MIEIKLKRILSVILILSIIATSFSSVVQISAQTDEHASIQVTAEDGSLQTGSRPIELTDEFIIRNKDDFSKFMTTTELWRNNCKVTLACNIDMKGKAFKPIKEFSGVFDGCEHTVNNILIKDSAGLHKSFEISFIKKLNKYAEFKNVNFENYSIKDTSIFYHSSEKISGFVLTNDGIISGVNIKNANINNINIENGKAAGFALNNGEHGLIENCFVELTNKNAHINSGFVGKNFGKITNSSTLLSSLNSGDLTGGFVCENIGTIEECSFNGNVISTKCAGGFCGKNLGEITSCTSEGLVKAESQKIKVVTICGGFVGENSGIINECSSIGTVTGQEYTGGFVGINNDKSEIGSCKATCDVKSHTYVVSIYCGGFVGLDSGKIENCTSNGKVSACVDSEKVLGGAVTAIVLTIVVITTIYLVSKYLKANANKDAEVAYDNWSKAVKNKEKADNHYSQLLQDDSTIVITAKNECERAADAYEAANAEMKAISQRCKDTITADWLKAELESNEAFYKWREAYREINNISNAKTHRLFLDWREAKLIRDDAYSEYCKKQNEIILNAAITIPLNNNFIISLFFGSVLGGVFLGGSVASIVETIKEFARGYANVGGFCGRNVGEIIKSSANINSFKAKTLYNKYNLCGGFVGTNGETGTIKDCSATGNEIHNKIYTGGRLGGFVGDNSGKIENGTTTVPVTNGKYTGGFCGNNLGEISGSKSEGNAKTLTNKTKCGGFVGNNEKGIIDGCTSIGSATGQEYVGGFCGDNSGDILKSKSKGNAVAKTASNTNKCGGFVGENSGNINDCNSKGSATGQEYVGGFVGLNNSDIIECNSTGKATAKTKTHTAIAGGFVGENEKGKIIDCSTIGGVNSQSSSGQAKAGGFVGVNKSIIMNSKASGYVYLSAGTCHKDDGCGGFVGKNDKGGSIDGCYAECMVETTNKKKGGGFVGEAKNKSTIINSKCKSKIVTKAGIKNNKNFIRIKIRRQLLRIVLQISIQIRIEMFNEGIVKVNNIFIIY